MLSYFLGEPNTLKRRIMRWAALIIAGVLLVVALLVVIGLQSGVRAQLVEIHSAGLEAVEHQVIDRLDSAAQDLRILTSLESTRAFAVDSTRLSVGALSGNQSGMIRDFLALLAQNAQYQAIRFITVDGSVWGTVTGRLGIQSTDVSYYREVYADHPGFQRARLGEPRQMVVGTFTLQTNLDGSLVTPLVPLITFYMPVTRDLRSTEILGYVELEVLAESVLHEINAPSRSIIHGTNGRRILLADENGQIVADSLQNSVANLQFPGNLSTGLGSSQLYLTLNQFLSGSQIDVSQVYRDGMIISTLRLPIGEAPNPTWRLIFLDEQAAIFAPTNLLSSVVIIGALLVAIFLVRFLGDTLTGILEPVASAAQMARRLAAEHLPEETTARTRQVGDEVVDLKLSIDNLSRRILDLTTNLNRQVARRTSDLQVASRIGRETATLHDVDTLVNRAINLICEELGFYHAQVFLVDDVGANAVLVYSRGEIGQKLLEQGHTLAVGSDTVIGTAVGSGQPVIVNDTRETGSGPHAFNPLLPQTRSELGLPLRVGQQVIGVLDIQSISPNAFKEDNLPTFELLADQLAVAIQNAQLITESERRVQQIAALDRRLTEAAWAEAYKSIGLQQSYAYNLLEIKPGSAAAEGDVAVPITVRGVTVGSISVSAPDGTNFGEGDQALLRAVAERVAYAIENARLFQETQLTLAETSTLYTLSSKLNEASSLEAIIQAIIQTLLQDASGGQIWTFDDKVAGEPLRIELRALFMTDGQELPLAAQAGSRYLLSELAFLGKVKPDQVTVVSSLETDVRLDAGTRSFFQNLGMRALLLIPLNMRGAWRGLIVIGFAQQRAIDERESRIYRALIDQAGVAIDNSLLLRQTEDALARNESLYAASRLINTAQTFSDLVNAVVVTSADHSRNFWLVLLEGEADAAGWPTQGRTVARSVNGIVYEVDEVAPLHLPPDSPLYQRRPEIIMNEQHPLLRTRTMKMAVIFPLFSGDQPVALFGLGSAAARDLTSEEYEVYGALSGQIAVQLENRRLFETAQSERETLRSILSTLPAGVLVLDAQTYKPINFNDKAGELLARVIDPKLPFSTEVYHLYRTGTELHYPEDELPIFVAGRTGEASFADDVALVTADTQIDLLINAAPIKDSRGQVGAIVVAFEDISNLRRLENTLQENLRETVTLYEAQRSLAEADTLDDVLDVIMMQLMMLQPADAYILMSGEDNTLFVARAMAQAPDGLTELTELLHQSDVVSLPDALGTTGLSERAKAVLREADIRALITVPIRVRMLQQPLGWLMIVERRVNGFSPDQERMITTLNDVASTAVDNRYLFQRTQAAFQETAALYDATSALSQAADLNALVAALQNALEFLQPDLYAAYFADNNLVSELFNLALDGPPANFDALISYHIPERGLYIEDLQDYFEDGLLRAVKTMGNIRALAVVNLRVKDSSGSRIYLAYHRPRRFTESDRRYLSAVVESTSLRADNLLLFDQIQATLEETSTLYQASRALSDASDVHQILDVITNFLIGSHINQVFIALLSGPGWNAAGAALQIVSDWREDGGLSMTGVTLTQDQFPAWDQLSTSSVLMINDVYDDARLDELARTGFESLDARSAVIIPLRVPQRVIGAIWLSASEPYPYSERDLRIYQAFAEQASLSLEAAHLLQQTERRARQLETSAVVGENIGRILDLDVLLPELVNLIRNAFNYDHVQVFLMDEADDWAVLRASTGEAGQQLLAIGHKLQKGSDSVIGQVTLSGKPTIALDTADATVIHKPNPYLPLTRSEMALPLVTKGRIVGALDVQSNLPNAFTDEDVSVLTTLSNQISVAIDNANLYNESQARAREMGFLFDLTTAAAASETLQDALDAVANRLYDALQALSVTIYLPQTYLEGEKTYTVMHAVSLVGSSQPLSEVAEVRIDDQSHMIGVVSTSLETLVIDDLSAEHGYVPVVQLARSAALVPLAARRELAGLILVEDSRPAAFGEETLRLLQTLARSLSAIIRSAQLLEDLSRVNQELRELDRLKSDFLANMSHELRTPLNSIIGFSRVMLKGIDGPLTEMQEQDLTTIYNSGQHLLMLINDILDQAKIASGKMDLKFGYFEIKPLVEGVRSIGVGLLKDKPINLLVEFAPSLPKCYGDEFRTRQVLLNLVSNAAKFTEQGSVTLRVYPEQAEDEKTFVRVDVIDTGIGVAEKDLPLLFEAFRQVDSSLTRKQGGTGLGLPISKSLIEMQGGRMIVNSRLNVGSVFSVTIPTEPTVAESTAEPEKPAKETASSNGSGAGSAKPEAASTPKATSTAEQVALSTGAPSGPPPKMMQARQVLLIEDNPDMVDQFRRILQREGFEVFAATIPLEAEAMASGLRPSLIVMDVNFAGGRGWDILNAIKNRDDTFDIPVIVVTLSDEETRIREAGAFAVVPRPFTPEDLITPALEAEKEANIERILIIDDQPESIRLIKDTLDEHGRFRVFAAHNGAEGISLVARRRPDLIILDLRMPEMDGFTVLDELRANPETAKIPVMVVTGDVISADEQGRLENVHVLQKTDLADEAYEQFIAGVRTHLEGLNGSG